MTMRCFTEEQLAEMTGISRKKLREDRMKLKGFPFIKIGRCVRYREEDVKNYLTANLHGGQETEAA